MDICWKRQLVNVDDFPEVLSVEELFIDGNRTGEVYSERYEGEEINWFAQRYAGGSSTHCVDLKDAKETLIMECEA